MVEAGNDNNCIFLSRNSKIKLFAEPDLSENIWSQDDLSVYNLIKCKKCGQKLGVHILETTLDDSLYMEGYLFLLEKLTEYEGNSNAKAKPNQKQTKGKKKSVPALEKGQLKLFF